MSETDDPIVEIERAMVAIRRSMMRRTVQRRTAGAGSDTAAFQVLDTVEAGDAVTVTDLTDVLNVDQPRASRLVARAVDDGHLRRAADPRDGRRSVLALTPRGRTVLAEVHAARQDALRRAMVEWSDQDRSTFARLLRTFVADWRA